MVRSWGLLNPCPVLEQSGSVTLSPAAGGSLGAPGTVPTVRSGLWPVWRDPTGLGIHVRRWEGLEQGWGHPLPPGPDRITHHDPAAPVPGWELPPERFTESEATVNPVDQHRNPGQCREFVSVILPKCFLVFKKKLLFDFLSSKIQVSYCLETCQLCFRRDKPSRWRLRRAGQRRRLKRKPKFHVS